MISESAAASLVLLSCALLDDEKFDDYVGLFDPGGRYRITTYSPDLRKELIYLDLDRTSLHALLRNVPHHVRLNGRLLRHASASRLELSAAGDQISAVTSVLVVRTDLEGSSQIFAAGRYHDVIVDRDGTPCLKSREVRLDTRQFGPGSHVPL